VGGLAGGTGLPTYQVPAAEPAAAEG